MLETWPTPRRVHVTTTLAASFDIARALIAALPPCPREPFHVSHLVSASPHATTCTEQPPAMTSTPASEPSSPDSISLILQSLPFPPLLEEPTPPDPCSRWNTPLVVGNRQQRTYNCLGLWTSDVTTSERTSASRDEGCFTEDAFGEPSSR